MRPCDPRALHALPHPPAAAARAGHDGHPGLDRGAGAARRRDRRATSAPRSAPSAWRARCCRASAVGVSLAIGPLIDRIGVRPLIVRGAALALAGAVLTAAAPSLPFFYAAHVITGVGRGLPAVGRLRRGGRRSFDERDAPWAMGYVVGAQSVAWIVGNPIIGLLADSGSWRLSYAVPAVISPRRPGRRADGAAHRHRRGRPRRGRLDPRGTGRRLPRPLGAPLDDRRAGGLLGLDRRADLRGRVLRPELRRVARPPWACCWRPGRSCSWSRSLNTARLTRRFPRRRLIVGASLGMGVMLIPMLNVPPSVLRDAGLLLRAGLVRRRALHRIERAGPRAAARPPGQHDGRANGQRPARLHDRRGRGRPRPGARGLRHARLRAVRRDGVRGCLLSRVADPQARGAGRPASAYPSSCPTSASSCAPAAAARCAARRRSPRRRRSP